MTDEQFDALLSDVRLSLTETQRKRLADFLLMQVTLKDLLDVVENNAQRLLDKYEGTSK